MAREQEVDEEGNVIGVPKDAQVRLFQDPDDLKMIPGEMSLAIVTRVEDVKVHPGQLGQLQITNIRVIWYFPKAPHINVSIGYRTFLNHTVSNSVQNGASQCEILFVRCKEGNRNYEFIFSANKSENSVFRFLELAIKNYDSSPLLREQKLRSSLIKEGNLILLQNEQVILQLDGVANFSGEVAKVGTAIVTNYRFVWYSEIVSNFNVSIPLILLPELRVSKSKRYGSCLYLKINSNGAHYMYGFTLQPEQKLAEFTASFEKVRSAAARMPLLTPPLNIQTKTVAEPIAQVEEDLELMDNDPGLRYLPCDTVSTGEVGNIVYDKILGLSIEALPGDETLSGRWRTASETPLADVDDL